MILFRKSELSTSAFVDSHGLSYHSTRHKRGRAYLLCSEWVQELPRRYNRDAGLFADIAAYPGEANRVFACGFRICLEVQHHQWSFQLFHRTISCLASCIRNRLKVSVVLFNLSEYQVIYHRGLRSAQQRRRHSGGGAEF